MRLLVVALLVFAASASAAGPAPYRLLSLKPYLYFDDTGGFSKEIPEHAPLFNSVIGEGWARHPSDATLVRVVVHGEGGSYAPNRFVRLTAQRGTATRPGQYRWGKTILDQRNPIGVLLRSGRIGTAFWVAHTGCVPLRLTARIGGQLEATPVTRIVPFECGD